MNTLELIKRNFVLVSAYKMGFPPETEIQSYYYTPKTRFDISNFHKESLLHKSISVFTIFKQTGNSTQSMK